MLCHLYSIPKLENVATANALQLEAARRRAVPIRCNSSPVPSLKSLSLSVGVLERFPADTLRYAVTLTFDALTLTDRRTDVDRPCVAYAFAVAR